MPSRDHSLMYRVPRQVTVRIHFTERAQQYIPNHATYTSKVEVPWLRHLALESEWSGEEHCPAGYWFAVVDKRLKLDDAGEIQGGDLWIDLLPE